MTLTSQSNLCWFHRQGAAPARDGSGVTAFLEKPAPRWPLSKVKDYPPTL
jgi:hypothetical protein